MKKFSVITLIILLSGIACQRTKNGSGNSQTPSHPYEASWESLAEHQVPQWLLDAKFGIYAHWGIYSVPAYGNEWYAKRMYQLDQDIHRHHVQTYGDPSVFGYKDFVPMFRAEHYNPDEWAQIIASSGARFAGFALVHHDGFCLWDSEHTRWNSMDMGPGRDLYGELVKSLRDIPGMKVIATFHHLRTFNWYLPYNINFYSPLDEEKKKLYQGKNWDIFDPAYGDLYWNEAAGRNQEDFIREWNNKLREVIDKYQPDVIWFDSGQFREQGKAGVVTGLLSYYYNREAEWNRQVEVLNKLGPNTVYNFPENLGMLTFEEGRDRNEGMTRPWIDDMKISDHSWGYVEGQTYKDADVIIDGLVDRVSRGGALLLSLCPMADGTINREQQNVLRQIGSWLDTNGEAIYGTRPWKIHGEGDVQKLRTPGEHSEWVYDKCNAGDIRFTRKDRCLYAIILGVPDNNRVAIKSLGSSTKISGGGIRDISLLGSDEELRWERGEDALLVELPEIPQPGYAISLKIDIRGKWADQ